MLVIYHTPNGLFLNGIGCKIVLWQTMCSQSQKPIWYRESLDTIHSFFTFAVKASIVYDWRLLCEVFSSTDHGDIRTHGKRNICFSHERVVVIIYHPTDLAPGYRDLYNMLLSYHESIITLYIYVRCLLLRDGTFFFTFSMSSHRSFKIKFYSFVVIFSWNRM